MNIQDIRYIVAVAETGSINRASNILFVTQPSLSRCIQKVEREYGISLFVRSQGAVSRLTTEGELFIKMAKVMLRAYASFMEELDVLHQETRQTVRLGLAPQAAQSLVDPLLERLDELMPNYRIAIQPINTWNMIQRLRDKELDLAVIRRVEGTLPESIYFELVGREEVFLFLRKGSPAAALSVRTKDSVYPILDLKALAGETFVVNRPGSNSRQCHDLIMGKVDIPCRILELPNHHNRINMARKGQASFLLSAPASDLPDFGVDVYRLPPGQRLYVAVGLGCWSGYQEKPPFQAVLQCLQNAISYTAQPLKD